MTITMDYEDLERIKNKDLGNARQYEAGYKDGYNVGYTKGFSDGKGSLTTEKEDIFGAYEELEDEKEEVW